MHAQYLISMNWITVNITRDTDGMTALLNMYLPCKSFKRYAESFSKGVLSIQKLLTFFFITVDLISTVKMSKLMLTCFTLLVELFEIMKRVVDKHNVELVEIVVDNHTRINIFILLMGINVQVIHHHLGYIILLAGFHYLIEVSQCMCGYTCTGRL